MDGYASVGPSATGEVGEAQPWLHGALARLGFRVVGSLDDVPPAATLLVHVTGGVREAIASLGMLADRVADRAPESALFLTELTHDGPPDESLVAAEHVEAVREALGARARGFAALVAVSPEAAHAEPFAFTRLVARAAAGAGDVRSARLSEIVERLGAMPERHTVAQGYAHVLGGGDFELGSSEGPALAPLLTLADRARDAHEWDLAIAGYRAALLVSSEPYERATSYARIGAAERAKGELREAKRVYEKARVLAPDDVATLHALVALSHDLGDWGRYVTLAREQVAHVEAPAEKVDLHFAIARALGQQLRDLPAAIAELEIARQLEPRRGDVLEALRRAYRVVGEWKKLIEITGVLADGSPSDAERSARRLAQARIALEKIGDGQLGIAFLDAALTEDPTNDEALDLLVEVRTTRSEYRQLGSALQELAERYDEMGDHERAKDARRCIEGLPSTPSPAMVPAPVVEAREFPLPAASASSIPPPPFSAPVPPPVAIVSRPAPAPSFPAPTARVSAPALTSVAPPPPPPRASAPAPAPALPPVPTESASSDLSGLSRLVEGRLEVEGRRDVPPSVPSLDVLPDADDLARMDASPNSGESTGPMVALPPTLEELPPDSLLEYEEPTGSSSPVESLPEPAIEVASPHPPAASPGLAAASADAASPDLAIDIPVDVPIFVAGETGLHSAIVNPDTIPAASAPASAIAALDDDNALLELEEAVARSPLDPSLHARLFALHARAGRTDRAFLTALALEELGAADEEQEAAIDQSRPEGPLRLRALLDAPAWESLRAPGSDDVIESLFEAVSSAAVQAQIEDRRGRRKLLTLDPERKQPPTSTVSIIASFQWAARVLGVACPDLYVLDDVPGDIAAVPSGDPSTALGPSVLSGLTTKELAFLAARHLVYYRREHAPLVHFSSLPELTLLVLACVQLELPGVPIPQSVAAQVASLCVRIARHLGTTDRSTMAAAVQRLESRGGRLDLSGWVRSVELTAARAGLFLCGDLRSAMTRLRSDKNDPVGSPAFEQARADLIAFTVSRAHADLRAEFALIAAPRASGLRSRDEVAIPGVGEAHVG